MSAPTRDRPPNVLLRLTRLLGVWSMLLWCARPTLASAREHADPGVELAPSDDGYIGAWLVSGPIPELGVAQTDLTAVAPVEHGHPMRGAWWPAFTPLSGAEGAINLARDLNVGTRAGPAAIAGVEVIVKQSIDAWLLLSCDGAVRVLIDGKPIYSRDSKRRREGSWDAVPVAMEPGTHRLVMLLQHRGTFWAFEARLLDRQTLNPPGGVRFRLPGTSAANEARLIRQMVSFELDTGLESWSYRPRLSVRFLRGAPDTGRLPVSVTTRRANRTRLWGQLDLGATPIGTWGASKLVAQMPRLSATDLASDLPDRYSLDVQVGPARRRLALTLDRASLQSSARAQEMIAALRAGRVPQAKHADTLVATLEYLLADLTQRGTSTHWERSQILAARRELDGWLDELASGNDPLQRRRGVIQMARRSALDGSAQPIRVHIPESYTAVGDRRYPLVVALHGYGGSGEGIMNAFLDTRRLSAHPDVDGFVIAPHAFGNSFYMGPGELDVLAAMDWAEQVFPIDPDRISITGVSMGGTGTAAMALKYPDRFSAAAPLCGYHSFFTHRNVVGRPTRPWETARIHHWSTSSWSENGRHLPFYVAHGTHDTPLANSRVLIDRFHALGYSMRDEWPDAGHRVWEITYKHARLWSWLTSQRRVRDPDEVLLKTDQLRYGKHYWLELLEPQVWGEMSEIHAHREGPSELDVKTSNTRRLRISGSTTWPKKPWAAINIDNQHVSLQVDRQQLVKNGKRWETAPLPDQRSVSQQATDQRATNGALLTKHRGSSGPIRDVFNEPLIFSYGTLDPSMTRANREVAEALRARARGDVAYPVLADTELTPELQATFSIVAVGNSESHALLSGLSTELPIVAGFDVLRVGKRRYEGSGLGATYVHPNPAHPNRYLLVVVGTDAPGIWRALSLPKLLPDFMIYDAALGDAAGQEVLGDGRVIGAGFFDTHWELPDSFSDPFDP